MAPQQDWLEKDFYKILGVAEDASEKDIQKSYRKLARKYHPDANPNDATAEERFKEISEAYEVIGSEESRNEYDQFRKYGPTAGFGGGAQNYSGSSHGFGGADFSGIFQDLFNQQGGGSSHQARGHDLESNLSISFTEAIAGVTTRVSINTEVVCDTCTGTGAKPGTTPELCTLCHGRGSQAANQGFFSVSQPCSNCQGRGMVIKSPCGTCTGLGSVRKAKPVTVKVPAGVKDGQRIRLKGKGAAGRYGAPAGNLYITLKVGSHEMYGRSGNHLTLKLPISFAEAALGSNVKVPLIDGSSVTLKVPEGTASGKTFRVKGKGVDSTKATGDLLVTVVVDVPTALTEDQKIAISELDSSLSSPRERGGIDG